MKKLLLCILLLALCMVTTSCGKKADDNIVFAGIVQEVYENSILVTTSDNVSFDRASVGLAKGVMLPSDIEVGQTVQIEALSQIRESYPVQITAVRVTIMEVSVAEYKKITAKEAQQMMNDNVIILDVRTQSEFDEGHIKGALLLPYDEIAEKAKNILQDKTQTILVYCRSGRRSELAAKELITMGYSDVYDFGGIIDWTGEIVK